MLGNFMYCNPTKLNFGEDPLSCLNEEIPKYGKNVQDDNYYSGTYEAHRGQAGLDFLAESLTEFEHTRETAERMIEDNGKFDEDYILDKFICFSCNNQSFMMNGQEQLDGDWQTAYYGFLAEEDSQLVILNLRTGTWYWFDKEEA